MTRNAITAGSERRSGIASVGPRRRRSAPKNITRTANKRPAVNAARKRYAMSSATEVRAEEGDSHRPGLACGGEVGTRLPVLLTQEAVSGAGEGMVFIALAQCLHRGIRGRNRRADSSVFAAI